MGKYGKIIGGQGGNGGNGAFLQHALIFLLFFVISFFVLTIIVFYGPFRNRTVVNDATLRFSAQDVMEEISKIEPFTDIKNGDDGYLEAMYLKKMGILKGYADGSYVPGKTMNRAEFVKVVDEVKHVYPHSLVNSYCFDDVRDDWYAPHVCSAKAKGWISGTSESFDPDRNITLAEVIKIIFTVSSIEVDEAVDGPWYEPIMQAAEDMDWFKNAGITDVDPEREVSRLEVAKLLYHPVRSGLLN